MTQGTHVNFFRIFWTTFRILELATSHVQIDDYNLVRNDRGLKK